MPLYTAITQEGSVTDETKAKTAEEITRIHTTLMKVPRSFVRVVFLSYPRAPDTRPVRTRPLQH
jgi:phenylpyruvate tautomerase PptA (4-oxalocrotonate tautomerase family)